ncbi:MAG: ATP-dependent DNA helicase [Candidatus Latescibacteria bacterium]|nr:ATP-dependent DNA helicase [Candidatus Latescibacterota bacterium]
MEPQLLKLSVRDLVAFGLRSGNLEKGGFGNPERAVEGTRGHQQVQRSRPAAYQSEVPISLLVETEEFALVVSGRIDGLLVEEDQVLIEEIKTTYTALDELEENPHHWAQAKIYAHFFAAQHQIEEIQVQLTYVHLDSGELKEECRTCQAGELAQFFQTLLDRYLRWMKHYLAWCAERDRSIEELQFPFPAFRRGQKQLMGATFRAIEGQGRLFAQAPTGIGKTISTLFPALKALGAGHVAKIFYLTAKTSGRAIAEKAIEDLRRSGLKCKNLTLTARERICFNASEGRPCDVQQCEYALGYYDRIEGALDELFSHDAIPRARVEEVARQHRVCPFELSLDLSLWADVIICDYNYIFDPRAYLRRFFLEEGGAYAFLIDEAHNLVDRAREMFSAELSRLQIGGLRRRLKKEHPGLKRALKELEDCLAEAGRRCAELGQPWVERELPHDLMPLLPDFLEKAEQVLVRDLNASYREELIELYFAVFGFQRIADLFGPNYATYAEPNLKDLCLKLFCMDPAPQLREALRRGTSAVFFSATLTPLEYFRQVLGGEEGDALLDLESPFPAEHFKLLLADHLDTSYKGRGQSFDQVAESIAALISQHRGNYLVFFPSYQYLQEVSSRFRAAHPDVEILVQSSGMSERQREEFLAVFDAENPDTLVGFAVMGGIFGEGIDLVGERLVGAIVVGVGLPQVCLERELIRAYYDEQEVAGFDFAYTFPGMNRVLQAAGRVIRSPQDRGVVLLIDRRFGWTNYRRLFPPHWRAVDLARNPAHISLKTEHFWTPQA